MSRKPFSNGRDWPAKTKPTMKSLRVSLLISWLSSAISKLPSIAKILESDPSIFVSSALSIDAELAEWAARWQTPDLYATIVVQENDSGNLRRLLASLLQYHDRSYLEPLSLYSSPSQPNYNHPAGIYDYQISTLTWYFNTQQCTTTKGNLPGGSLLNLAMIFAPVCRTIWTSTPAILLIAGIGRTTPRAEMLEQNLFCGLYMLLGRPNSFRTSYECGWSIDSRGLAEEMGTHKVKAKGLAELLRKRQQAVGQAWRRLGMDGE